MTDRRAGDMPLVSFGLPVRNGAATIAQAIEAIRAQTLEDWELVISDNLSSDGTSEICASSARLDARIRHVPTQRDLSQNENFSEAFRLARGVYFRWYGDDDWLEPTYAERTVAAMESEPDAVLCTTLQRYYSEDIAHPLNDAASRLPGVRSSDPIERLAEFVRLIEHADWFGIDPVYSLARRDAVARTGLMRPYRFGDFVFACELALLGSFAHVPEMLAHRRVPARSANADALARFTNRDGWSRYVQREICLVKVWQLAGSSATGSRLPLVPVLAGYAAREHLDGLRRRADRLVQRVSAGLIGSEPGPEKD